MVQALSRVLVTIAGEFQVGLFTFLLQVRLIRLDSYKDGKAIAQQHL